MAAAQRQPGQSHPTQSPHASLTPPHHPLPSARQPVSQNNSQPHQLISPHHQQPPYHHQQTTTRSWLQPGLRRTLSGEVESPAESEVYSLRSRRAPRALTDPPSFHDSPTGHPSHSVHDFFMCHTKVGGCLVLRVNSSITPTCVVATLIYAALQHTASFAKPAVHC